MKKSLILLCCLSALSANSVLAYDSQIIEGKNFSYQFDIYEAGEEGSTFEITSDYTDAIFAAAKRWADIIKSNTDKPIAYTVLAFDEYNASALGLPVRTAESPYAVSGINAEINNLTVTEKILEVPMYGILYLGKGISEEYPGWGNFTGYHALYHGTEADLSAVIMHEFMHSLGMASYAGGSEKVVDLFGSIPFSIYDSNLRIYTGDTTSAFDPSKEIAYEEGMKAGKGSSDFDVINNSPYFDGIETIKVIGGKDNYEDAKQAIIDNGGLTNYSFAYELSNRPQVYGLPIHPTDILVFLKDYIDTPAELSHIELRNSLMSHQSYRNWLIPMEAELALLKDIGYDIDLRNFFGKSYYLNGITDTYTQGFGEWDALTGYTGNPSNVIQAVGLHVYGDNNNITQASDILLAGEGSFGARIEGIGNTYTLASGSNIFADGKENIALGATWGKDHVINVESGAKVTALGEDGIAVSFDFGNNVNSSYAAEKGSYIKEDKQLYSILPENYVLSPDTETQGALVDSFNVSGTLEGKKAAIYISDNAWVKDININDGASIKGDIISDWNSVSTANGAPVKIKDGTSYRQRNIEIPSEMLNTNLNFLGISTVDGNITGENGVNNTLIMNNYGTVNLNGETIAVKEINNSGTVNLSENVKTVGNKVNLNENSVLSTQNDVIQNVSIEQLNSSDGSISFDLGDTFTLNKDSETDKGNVNISTVNVTEETAKSLDNTGNIDVFTDKTVNLTGSSNVYYSGNKYEIKQDSLNKKILSVYKDTSGASYELGDASTDSTTGNYIVTESALTKDAGIVNSKSFKITGNDINVNGNSGLVIDGSVNTEGTTINTSIYGANDSNITVQNSGNVTVSAKDKPIMLGNLDEIAIMLNNGRAGLNTENNGITVNGAIKGNDNTQDFIQLSGNKAASINKTDNVTITTEVPNVNLGGAETNTNWIVNYGTLNVKKDSYLGADGTNSLTFNGCGVNLINDMASDIKLSSLTLNDKMEAQIDVDLKNQTADRFVFDDKDNVTTNGNKLEITQINLLNLNTALTKEKYEIPIASSKYNSENLVGSVEANIDRNLLTPVYKYNMTYEDDGTEGNIALNRSNTGSYNDYNPAIYTGAVAAQAGGFLNQINSYETAFSNMDMITSMPQRVRNAMKMRNKYAAEGDSANLMTYNPNQLPQEGKGVWARPYASYEKIGMKHGPRVESTSYGSYFGGDTAILELGRGWDGVFSGYAGYNGSHQNYQGNSIYQNGGQLGATGVFYKDKFFTGVTANVGAGVADASTMYGDGDIVMLNTGVASKTGYNIGFNDDKFIIQPSWLMSYSFVNTFDYTNAAGVRVKSDPLNAVQLAPGIKLIGNLPNGWQPYLGAQMVWNILDKAKFKANDAYLEQISIKPYVQYGIGVQKQTGERFTGYAQSMLRNGGRRGLALSAGFRLKV